MPMSWMLAPVIISPVASHTVDGVDAERDLDSLCLPFASVLMRRR